jgi:transcriptional regulator with XRE-family HTH domain
MNKTEENSSIGLRLTQERKRLGYNQVTLSAKAGISSATQISYEADGTRPDADYLCALNELGADIFYIITGEQLEALTAEDAHARFI